MITNIVYLITELTTSSLIFISSLITIYIAWKQAFHLTSTVLPSCKMSVATLTTGDGSTTATTRSYGLRGMLKTISNNKGFKAFMKHLVKEWAAENLLFLVELIQIKYEFQIKHFDFDQSMATPTMTPLQSILNKN